MVSRGKRQFKLGDARRALLDAGKVILVERGIAPGLDRVTLREAIELSGVPRSTAYRAFDDSESPLESFRDALLVELESTGDPAPIVEIAMGLLADARGVIESGDPIAMAFTLREMTRAVFGELVILTANDAQWRGYISTVASSAIDDKPELRAAVAESARQTTARYLELLNEVGRLFGIRITPPLTWLDFARAYNPAQAGAALRHRLDVQSCLFERATGPAGETYVWHSAAIAAEGLLLAFTEPDPLAAVSADLDVWRTSRRI